jgi:hypothetical protein
MKKIGIRLAVLGVVLGALLVPSLAHAVTFQCGEAQQDTQNPAGSYTAASVKLPGAVTWTNVSITVANTTPGITSFVVKNPAGFQTNCTTRWNHYSFQAFCPRTPGVSQPFYFEGTQSNNGFNAVLTGNTYSDLHGLLGAFSASGTVNGNYTFTGIAAPCPMVTSNPPLLVGANLHYNWNIGPSWFTGAITVDGQNGVYYHARFANPNNYPNWLGDAMMVLGADGLMNFYIWTNTGTIAPCDPFGCDSDPVWAWHDWVNGFYYNYAYSQYIANSGRVLDVF